MALVRGVQMATQPQVPTAKLLPSFVPPSVELPVGQPTASQQAFLIRFGSQFTPAIGQPGGPKRQGSEPLSSGEIKNQHLESTEPGAEKETARAKQTGFWSLKKTAFFSGLLLIAPAAAAIFSHNTLGCLVASVSLGVWYILVFTVLLLLEDKISPFHLVELWRTALNGLGTFFKSKSGS